MLRNTERSYGLLAIFMHWGSAAAVIGLFAVGFWMVDLTYYSSWYRTAPHLHKSIGLILLLLTIFRLAWRFYSTKPVELATHKSWEKRAGRLAHNMLYLLMLLIMLSGYFISTADGRGIWVFDWFEIPGFGELISNQADIAGAIHQYFAYGLIALVVIHALGALKHHFIDKDQTLSRMLKVRR
ncbi:cytochrome b [Shewanella sp. 1CM18E]|uniref:cytochrome b n=1 Tax=Shewanella sp. 1CM18E TaxID=2929169 RepID=UPI0020BEA7A9|nr:cytochrome b [Shewanella sp. 1CM18E]MCK8043595.1 cytochrome b [Shewanella sp. 1CM18E]